jgi:hypothetical protein
VPSTDKFFPSVLAQGDVLVIASALGSTRPGQPDAATSAFTTDECAVVRDWVEAGGGLLFITDHAPMGAAARGLAVQLGVDVSTGATADPAHSEGDATHLVFSRANQLLGDHAITRGRSDSERINRIQTFTGTSLKGPTGSTALLKLADSANDLALGDRTRASAAGRAQGIAFRLGQGRVVVLGEASALTAQVGGPGGRKFGMNVAGLDNRQMALNIMHWLSRLLEPGPGGAAP